jgi:hypothetical protein
MTDAQLSDRCMQVGRRTRYREVPMPGYRLSREGFPDVVGIECKSVPVYRVKAPSRIVRSMSVDSVNLNSSPSGLPHL